MSTKYSSGKMIERRLGRLHQRPAENDKPKQQEERLTVECGHNGERVIVRFQKPIENLVMHPSEVDAHIESLQGALRMLRQHMLEKAAKAEGDNKP